MKTYELVTEIFNKCSGNQMRDVAISEVSTDDPRAYVEQLLKAHKSVEIEADTLKDGALIFNVNADGLLERFSFTEI